MTIHQSKNPGWKAGVQVGAHVSDALGENKRSAAAFQGVYVPGNRPMLDCVIEAALTDPRLWARGWQSVFLHLQVVCIEMGAFDA